MAGKDRLNEREFRLEKKEGGPEMWCILRGFGRIGKKGSDNGGELCLLRHLLTNVRTRSVLIQIVSKRSNQWSIGTVATPVRPRGW
jgi:hypothetical protein